jgi:methyl coenzyme M reductase subunit C-like uncharacterized protein (methanogenesis marker protein 7)
MKTEIEEALGHQIQQEISRGFLENISGFTQLIQDNFTQMKETLMNAISNEKMNEIKELKA